jgi:hypothetical protein
MQFNHAMLPRPISRAVHSPPSRSQLAGCQLTQLRAPHPAPVSLEDPALLRSLAARAEFAGAELRRCTAATAMQIASVRWRGPAARTFDTELGGLLVLVRRTADDLDQMAVALRRELARLGRPR